MSNTKKITHDKWAKEEECYLPIIKSPYQYRYEEESSNPYGEVNLQPSMTIQGEAYTIRELLKKHASGTMPDLGQEGIYVDDLDHDSLDYQQFKNLDLAEQQQYRDNQKEYIKQLNKTIKESEKSLLSQQQQQTEQTPQPDKNQEN